MNPTIWKMSGPFDPKIKAALPDCDRQSGDRGGFLGRWRASRPWCSWTKEQVDDFVIWVMCGVILGARLGYVLFYYIEEALQYEDKNAIWRLFPEAFG